MTAPRLPLWLKVALGVGLGAATLRAQVTHQLPPRALILGVPFISWSEAASLDYAQKDILNPSLPAAEGMVLKYWGRDLATLKQDEDTPPGWTRGGGDGGSVDSLKAMVSRGIPVLACLAMTPIAHNPGPGAAAMLAMSDSTTRAAVEGGGSASGVLGQMVALDTLRRWGQVLGAETLRESAFMACRVVIGYDDPRKVIILHDPSFGPAWELSYADFETMWSFWSRFYMAMYPNDFARVLAKRPAASPYPARTAAQHAAEDYMYGYALAAVGRRNEAESRLKAGLAIPELPSGYRHVMLLELARLAEARHDTVTAIATYRQAGDVLPQDNRSWLFLGQLLHNNGHAGSQHEADSLLGRAAALCADTAAQQAAWRALPHDYVMVSGCEESAAPESTAPLGPDEIRYLLPTRGWEEKHEGSGSLMHVEVAGSRYQAISVWPIDVPAELRELPREQQVRAYFAMERQSPRDVRWTGFKEGTRDIAGRRYPTLSAQIHLDAKSKPPVLGDVLFLVIYPDDFLRRQRFYVVMWMDYHPAKERGAGPQALDLFISGLTIPIR